MAPPNPRFRRFDRDDLEDGLASMGGKPEYSGQLKYDLRAEILYRIEHQEYEADCRARKALTGGYDG